MNLTKILERTSALVIIIGTSLIVLGAAGRFSIQGYQVEVKDMIGRSVLVIGGSILLWKGMKRLEDEERDDVQLLDMQHAFPKELVLRAKSAQKFIFDTNLSEEKPRKVVSPQNEYRIIRDSRVMKGEIGFKRVEIIYNKERFKSVLRNLIRFEGKDYYVRYYEAPPKAIPLLHVMTFDDEYFFLGGFYPPDFPPGEEKVAFIRGGALKELLREYTQMLWLKAIPLNEGGQINWEEIKRIARRLGISLDELETMIHEIKHNIDK